MHNLRGICIHNEKKEKKDSGQINYKHHNTTGFQLQHARENPVSCALWPIQAQISRSIKFRK